MIGNAALRQANNELREKCDKFSKQSRKHYSNLLISISLNVVLSLTVLILIGV